MKEPMMITAFGVTGTASQWEKLKGIKSATIRYRIRKGWSPEQALTEKATIGNNQHLRA